MKFSKEDEIITAEEARDRSEIGREDSIIRENIRDIMRDIKQKSFYGYRILTKWVYLVGDEEFKKIKIEIVKFGFKIKLKETKKTNLSNRFNYIIDIQW